VELKKSILVGKVFWDKVIPPKIIESSEERKDESKKNPQKRSVKKIQRTKIRSLTGAKFKRIGSRRGQLNKSNFASGFLQENLITKTTSSLFPNSPPVPGSS